MNKDYTNILKKLISEKSKSEKELSNTENKKKNSNWINKFIKVGKVESLNKDIIDELIDKIEISNSGNIIITFRYQDEYFMALDFIKNNFCDIIRASV